MPNVTLGFKKEKKSLLGKMGNFFKKNKAIKIPLLLFASTLIITIIVATTVSIPAAAIFLPVGLSATTLSIFLPQHFDFSRKNRSSVKYLEEKKKSLDSKRKFIEEKKEIINREIESNRRNNNSPLMYANLDSRNQKVTELLKIVHNQSRLLFKSGSYTKADFKKNFDALDSEFETIDQECQSEENQYQELLSNQRSSLSTIAQQKHSPELSVSSDSENSTQSSSRENSPVSIEIHSFNDKSSPAGRLEPQNILSYYDLACSDRLTTEHWNELSSHYDQRRDFSDHSVTDSGNSTQSSSRENSPVGIETHSFNDDPNDLPRVKPINRRNSSAEITQKQNFR